MGRIRGDLLERTMRFSVALLRSIDHLPNNSKGWEIGRQLIRSGTSIGANVREAHHALTDADFAYKCSTARKEASETLYWLELCRHVELLPTQLSQALSEEADELVRILLAIVKGTQEHLQGPQK